MLNEALQLLTRNKIIDLEGSLMAPLRQSCHGLSQRDPYGFNGRNETVLVACTDSIIDKALLSEAGNVCTLFWADNLPHPFQMVLRIVIT